MVADGVHAGARYLSHIVNQYVDEPELDENNRLLFTIEAVKERLEKAEAALVQSEKMASLGNLVAGVVLVPRLDEFHKFCFEAEHSHPFLFCKG